MSRPHDFFVPCTWDFVLGALYLGLGALVQYFTSIPVTV